MSLVLRPCTAGDAEAMCALLNAIIARGGTTAHRTPFDTARMRALYVAPPTAVSCIAALIDGTLCGYQAVQAAAPDWPEPYRLPPGWGDIATFVALDRQGAGLGSALFARTRAEAAAAGLQALNATIRRENRGGLRYYTAMGFCDWRVAADSVSKRFDLTAGP